MAGIYQIFFGYFCLSFSKLHFRIKSSLCQRTSAILSKARKREAKKSCAKKGRLDPTLSIRKGMEDVSIHYHGQNVPTWFCSLPSPEMFNSEREMEFLNNSNRDLNPNALNEV
jgi:hypothetical protein